MLDWQFLFLKGIYTVLLDEALAARCALLGNIAQIPNCVSLLIRKLI